MGSMDEGTVFLIGTGISFVVSVGRILSFQIKSIKTLTVCQAILSAVYAVSFIFLGKYQGAVQNLISTVVRFVSLFDHQAWAKSKAWIPIFSACYFGFGLYFYPKEGWVSLLTGAVMVFYVAALWSHDAVKYKINYFCTTAPAWITYDLVARQYFGAATEAFNMVSIAVSLTRKHFEDKKRKQAENAAGAADMMKESAEERDTSV